MQFTEWGPVEIEQWLTRCQFDHAVVTTFTKHNIVGETLPFLTDEHLREMEFPLQERIKLKIELNRLLIDNGVSHGDSFQSSQAILNEIQRSVQMSLDAVTKELRDELHRAGDDMGRYKPLPTPEKAPASPFSISPTKVKQSSQTVLNSPVDATLRREKARSFVQSPTQTQIPTLKPMSEPLKQLRASTDDPCSKLLQAAMKRHKLNDDWRNYALVICYGDKERLLKLDEKPVQIFKELKEKGEHPAIMLRQLDYAAESRNSGTPGGML